MKREHLSDSLIQEYLDGTRELAASDTGHLLECVACRDAIEQYREMYVSLADVESPKLSGAFEERVMGRVMVQKPERRRAKVEASQWFWVGGLTVAACLISAVAIGPTALRELAVQFHGLGTEWSNATQAGAAQYMSNFNLKPSMVLLSMVTLGGIILMDRLLVRVRRTRRFLSLMA